MRVLLVVLAALISLGTLGGLGVLAVGIGSIRVVTDTRALPANVRSLTVDTGDVAAVRITTDVDAKEPRVDARMVTGTNDTQLTVVNNDISSQVTVRDKGARLLGRHNAGELKVILPPGVARELSVTVNQRSGKLSIDANLDQLVANTEGAVTLGGSARRIGVNARRRGDIRTSGPIAVTESFTADTEYGRISVEFRVAPRTTEAIAGGDVTVGLPVPGPYRVRAQSQGGQTTVTVQETSDSSAPEVMARSKGANVKVTELR